MARPHHLEQRRLPMRRAADLRPRLRPLARMVGMLACALLTLLAGVPLLHAAMRGDPLLGFANGALLLFVALRFLGRVRRGLLVPLAAPRERGDGHPRDADQGGPRPPPLHRWQASVGPPATLAILQDAALLLVDSSTGIAGTRLRRADILAVEPLVQLIAARRCRHWARVGLGLPLGGGLILSLAPGPARRPPPRVRTAVSVRYRLGPDVPARTTLLACRDAAEARLLAATIAQWIGEEEG